MKIVIEEGSDKSFTIRVVGSLDSDNYTEFTEQTQSIFSKDIALVVLDLEALDYVSTMGISAVLKLTQRVKEKGGQFALLNLKPNIRKVFEVIKAFPLENMFSSIEEADHHIDTIQKKDQEGLGKTSSSSPSQP